MPSPTPLPRRSFLGRLGAFALLGALPLPPRRPTGQQVLLRTPLAGVQFRIERRDLEALTTGEELRLAREPRNRYDPNAVRVDAGLGPIGYLPRDRNSEIARRLDDGEELTARLVEVRPDRPLWEALVVEVRGRSGRSRRSLYRGRNERTGPGRASGFSRC